MAYIMEDFPAPVLPMIPIFYLFSIEKLTFFKIRLELSLYLKLTFLNSTFPD